MCFKSHPGRKNVIRLLIEKGVNVFAKTNHREKASEIAEGRGCLLLKLTALLKKMHLNIN